MPFLSCLYGSERNTTAIRYRKYFLSCLYGSEPNGPASADNTNFLSCLYGSELNPFHSIQLFHG